MDFQKIVTIVMSYHIDRGTAENIAQDILCYHPCGDCIYYGDCKNKLEECEYSDAYIEEESNNA